MEYKGIIFDKDGTLFDYYTVWAPVMREAITSILSKIGKEGDKELEVELLEILGIGVQEMNPKGLIFMHNKVMMLVRLFLFSKAKNIPYKLLYNALKTSYYGSEDLIKASLVSNTDETLLLPLFKELKERGYIIGIVTSDNKKSTAVCLDHFHILPYIDMVSTYDDHYRRKPHPQSFKAFCNTFSLSPSEVIVVGDATVDMVYASRGKAGYKVGVLTGSNDIENLSKVADIVYPTIQSLFEDKKIFN